MGMNVLNSQVYCLEVTIKAGRSWEQPRRYRVGPLFSLDEVEVEMFRQRQVALKLGRRCELGIVSGDNVHSSSRRGSNHAEGHQ